MQTGFRYRMEHLGDYFVDMIDKVSEAARCSARGVILTYDIRFLKKKRQGLISELGARVAQLRKMQPDDAVFSDETLREILTTLDETEKRYNECVEERKTRLYPATSCACSCGTTVEETHSHDEGHAHDEGSRTYEPHVADEPHTHEEMHSHDEPHVHEELHIHEGLHTHEEPEVSEVSEVHDEPHTDDEPDVHEEMHAHDEAHSHEEPHGGQETTPEASETTE